MKTFYLTLFFIIGSINTIYSQISVDTTNCYKYYLNEFNTKGVNTVKDGMHKVIMTVRYKEDSMVTKYCREGMIRIENNKFVSDLYLKDAKGKYVKASKKADPNSYKKYKIPTDVKVVNGRSQTYVAENGALVDLFIIDVLKE